MARKSFEVISLKFSMSRIYEAHYQKEDWVRKQLNKNLQSYDTKTTLKKCYSYPNYQGSMVCVDFSTELDLITVISIVQQIYEDTGKELIITYQEREKIVMVKE